MSPYDKKVYSKIRKSSPGSLGNDHQNRGIKRPMDYRRAVKSSGFRSS